MARRNKILLFEEFCNINEGIQSDIKKYIKKNNKLHKSNWDEALDLIVSKIQEINPKDIAGHVGDMISLESAFAFKKLFMISSMTPTLGPFISLEGILIFSENPIMY